MELKSRLQDIWSALRSRFGVVGLLLVGGIIGVEVVVDQMLFTGESPGESGIFEKLDAGERLSIHERILLGVWEAEYAIAVLCAILLGLCWFWARKLPDTAIAKIEYPKLKWPFWALLFAAVVLAGGFRAPRLDHSLWNDEELAVRKYIIGSYAEDSKSGELQFRPVAWERTLFYSLSGNNHILQSVASRFGNSVWAAATGAETGAFNETALRMGSFLAGLATVALFGFWIAREGHPRAGITAAFILALNPWHIRYAAEARGYSILLLCVALLFFCLRPALLTNRWRWWLGFGIAQALALLSFAASLFLILPLNLIILFLLIKSRSSYGFWRWMFVCTCGAGLVTLFMLPTIISSMGWLNALNETELNSRDWPRELWGHMMLGTHWFASQAKFEDGIGIRNMIDESFVKQAFITVGIPLLALLGAGIAIAKNYAARLHIGIMVGAIVAVGVYRFFSDTPFHVWYAIYLLFLFVITLGFLGEATSLFPRKKPRPLALQWLPVVLVIVGYAWITHSPRTVMIAHERHPMRRAVEKIRHDVPAVGAATDLVTVSFGSGAKQFRSYDPRVKSPKTLAEFTEIRKNARKKGQQLSVYVTGPRQVRRINPELLRALENRNDFENLGLMKGIESFWGIQLYQAK